ncbi:MAG: hypothetical protein ACRDL0_08295 [Thermoleophilaceae bacterium]
MPVREQRLLLGAALPAGRRLSLPLRRGGRLIARSLAVRPPPLASAS